MDTEVRLTPNRSLTKSKAALRQLGLDLRHRHLRQITQLQIVVVGIRRRFLTPFPLGLVFLIADDVVEVVGDVDPFLPSLSEPEELAIPGNYEKEEKRKEKDEGSDVATELGHLAKCESYRTRAYARKLGMHGMRAGALGRWPTARHSMLRDWLPTASLSS
ncbi:hypothetical protein L484_015438 [Morus notabilis]|uniref:Uncharacterized protein n=1 Tax=Morus notabilis TaxID=981085 RepID=W9R9K5_9ROSA|nr:hypothetical protein L484_015438 [Morus notabilis]